MLTSTSGIGNFVYSDKLNPGLFSLDSAPFGIPYDMWLATHTLWLIQIPGNVHPMTHYTPDKCATGQSGPVWFLTFSQTKEERTCTIPSDKAILLPVLAGNCVSGVSPDELLDDSKLTECAMEGNDPCCNTASVWIDGREIKNLWSYKTQSSFFNMTIHDRNNLFDYPPGSGKSQTDGIFLFLEPLSVGNHTIQIKTTTFFTDPRKVHFNYSDDLIYHLIIPS